MSAATAKEAMRRLATKAQEVVADETKTFTERREELDRIEVEIKGFADEVAVHEKAAKLAAGADAAPEEQHPADPQRPVYKSLGQQVVESDAYKKAVDLSRAGSSFHLSTEVKAANTVNEGTTFANGFPTGQGGAAVLPDFLPGIVELRFRRLLIAQLMATGATESDQISYVKETLFNNNAAGTSEASALPQTDDTIARVVEQVGKIGHFMKVTDELLQDAGSYNSFLQNRMVFGVNYKEDSELLYGAGYPSVPGLLTRSGMQTALAAGATGTPSTNGQLVVTAIYQMINNVRFNAFVEPDAIVVNPIDWFNIRTATDANQQFYGGGPFTGAYGSTNWTFSNTDALWGLPVVITPAINAGSICVGGFRENAQVFRRHGVTIEMTNSNVDDFQNGLITTRAYERLALAVYRPGAFGLVNPTW